MKTKSISKMLIAMLVGLSMTMSLSISVFADYDGTEAGYNPTEIIGGGGVYEADQGFRLSLVTADSGTVYSGNVVDIEIKQTNGGSLYDNANHFGDSTASDPSSKGQLIRGGTPYENVIDAPKPMIWNGSSFVGNGNEVKSYMLKKDGNGDQNILAYAKEFLVLNNTTVDKIRNGELKIELEPIYNFPIYNSNGQYTGDRFVGSVREFIEDYVRPTGYGNYNQIAPALRGAVQAMILEEGDLGLEAMDPSEIEAMIDYIIEYEDFSKLGLGLHIFNLGDTIIPSIPSQPTPTPQNVSINITESRITKRENLANLTGSSLSTNNFKWKADAFDNTACDDTYHDKKGYTDNKNTVNVEQSVQNTETDGVIKNWTFVTDGNNATTTKFVNPSLKMALFLLPTDKQNSYSWF